MRLEDLKLFLVIADCQNLRQAAERAGMTQPALTKALRRLENELGVMLFDRLPRGLVLTKVGQSFFDRIHRVDLQLAQALREVDDIRSGELGLMRFGTTAPNVEGLFLPTILEFLQQRPAAHYKLSVHITAPLLQELTNGQLDLVLAGVPHSIDPGLESQQLFVERLHIVARVGHPLLSATADDLARFANARWLLPPKATIGRRWVEERLAELKLPPPSVAVESNAAFSLLAKLLRGSDLLSIMTESVLNSPAGRELTKLDALTGHWQEPMAVYWRRDTYLSPLVRDFRDRIVAAAQVRAGLPGPPAA